MALGRHLWSFSLIVDVTTLSVLSPLRPLTPESLHFSRNASVNLNRHAEEIVQWMKVTKGG